MKLLSTIVICPYCHSDIHIKLLNKDIGYAQCDCDEYPYIEKILYIQKDDEMLNRRVVLLIKSRKILLALILLLKETKLHRILILIFYFIYKFIHINLPRSLLLYLLIWSSGNKCKNWFKYLYRRSKGYELSIVSRFMQQNFQKKSIILDVGFGIGNLYEYIQNQSTNFFSTYIGLEKNFFTLFIARLYIHDSNVIFICSNVDTGIPIKDNMVNSIIFLDSFAYMHNKNQIIYDASRILKPKGNVSLLHMYDYSKNTYLCGYGVSPYKLKTSMSHYFSPVILFNTLDIDSQKQRSRIDIDKNNYSLSAVKK